MESAVLVCCLLFLYVGTANGEGDFWRGCHGMSYEQTRNSTPQGSREQNLALVPAVIIHAYNLTLGTATTTSPAGSDPYSDCCYYSYW